MVARAVGRAMAGHRQRPNLCPSCRRQPAAGSRPV